jgi:hypothetical protein
VVSVAVSVWVAQMGETLYRCPIEIVPGTNDSVLHCRLVSLPPWQPEKIYAVVHFAGVPVEINGILQPMNFIGYSDWLPVNKGTQRSRPLILFFSFFFQVVPVPLLPQLFDDLLKFFFVVGDGESRGVG